MKTIKYDDLCDINKIRREYHHVRVKTKNREKIVKYEMYLGCNLIELYETLKKREYIHNSYNIFIIKEPKYRIIMSEKLNDKIVNHLVSNEVLIPLISPKLVDCNVATRKNKGTSYGLNLALKYINKLKNNYNKVYVLKMDIKKYFFNIDHDILLYKLKKIIDDQDIYNLIENIIRSSDSSYVNNAIKKAKQQLIAKLKLQKISDQDKHILEIYKLPEYKSKKGLPIGNLSSQILAIFYLNDVDHFIKEKLKIKYYIRYMDDFIIFHHDKEYLKYVKKLVEQKILDLKLEFNDKTNIYDLNHGVSFLGYRFILFNKKLIVKINNQTKRRIKKKIKNLKVYDIEKLKRVRASYKGYLNFSNTNIKKILK